MIEKLNAKTFAEIASNGLPVELYEKDVSEYIDNLKFFITSLNNDMWVSDNISFGCKIAKGQEDILNIVYSAGKSHFILEDETFGDYQYKLNVSIIINTVYMHAVAWAAIHNGGIVSENKIPKPCEPWPI